MLTKTLLICVLAVWTSSNCVLFGQAVLDKPASSQQTKTSSQTATVTESSLGSTINVHQCGSLYFSGQFAKEDLSKIQETGIGRIITLRNDDEINWNEQDAVEAAGIEMVKVPFGSPDELTDEVFDKVRKLLRDDSEKTLLHCGSASRVGGVWLAYRVLDEGVDLETALAEAEEIGLRTPFVKTKARDYIERNKPTTMAGESSVKPGINKKFLDPNLDVDEYIKRFEIESREVFVARERILTACEIEKGDVVADVGAGTGLFTRMFSVETGQQGWVFAVDVAPRFIEHINQDAIKLKLDNITGVLCAENSVNLPADSVDVVFVCDTYHHFEYPKSTLASIHRALKQDGHLIVIDFERIPGVSREWLLNHVRAGKSVFRSEIESAGFVLDAEKDIDGFEENYFMKFRKAN